MKDKENSFSKKKKKVAFYIRLSTDDQKEMYGEPLQISSLKGLLKSKEYDLEFAGEEYIYKDLGVSGSIPIEKRPGLKKLFNDLKYGKPFDIIAVYKIDRFARSLKVLLDIVEKLEDNGIDFISSLESIDTTSPFGKAMLGILGVFSELEKDMNQKKLSAGLIESIKLGNKISDIYGYDRYSIGKTKHFKVNAEESKVIKSIFEDFTSANHKGDIGYIRNRLIENKILIPSMSQKSKKGYLSTSIKDGYKWHNTMIKRILEDEVYTGIYYYGKTESIKDKESGKTSTKEIPKEEWITSEVKHTPIISDTLFYKAQEIISSKSGKEHIGKHTNPNNIYIFSGLLKCDCCKEHKLTGGYFTWIGEVSNGGSYYICKGKHKDYKVCHTIPIKADDLEKIILGEIKSILQNPISIKKYVSHEQLILDEKERLEKELENVHKHISKYNLGMNNIEKKLKFGEYSYSEYENDKNELTKLINKEKENADEIKDKLQGQFNLEEYVRSIKVLGDILEKDMEEIFNNKLRTQKFIQYLIDEVIIYSKLNDGNYIISGKKKEGQMIPYKIEVKLKLPQVFLDEFLTLNNINHNDIIGSFTKENEDKEKKDDDNSGNGGGSIDGNEGNIYQKTSKKINSIKNNLIKNIIRVKNTTSPYM